MRVSTEISAEERMALRHFFRLYGSVQPLLNETGIHRMTLNRLLKTGRATVQTVEKVRAYVRRRQAAMQQEQSSPIQDIRTHLQRK